MKRSLPRKTATSLRTVFGREKLLEEIAELEHRQWMEWSKTNAQRVDPETRARWQKYWVPYAKLSEKVKEQDRVWARKILAAIDRAEKRDAKKKSA
jgi:hypothetical protein